tara:strand:+ start:644 stop:2053 length:1410 start_codon:yes stop_codon:yes gene_type:complete
MKSTDLKVPDYVPIARIGRVRENILSILDVTEQSYKGLTLGWSQAQKKAYEVEEREYVELCSNMACHYQQWSSNLLLEAPLPGVADDDRDSSLIALVGSLWSGAAYSAKKSSAPQHVRDAIKQVGVLARYRQFYLEALVSQLKTEEKSRFEPLLGIWYPPGGSLPDIKATEMYYRLEGIWQLSASVQEQRLLDVPTSRKYEETLAAYAWTSEYWKTYFESDLPVEDDAHPDSLAARLLLSALLNRGRWECAEYERFEILASNSIEKLLISLELLDVHSIPSYREPETFSDWVLEVLGKGSPIAKSEWRVLKCQHLPRFFSCAEWIVGDLKERDLNANDLYWELREKRNLCVLAMAWSYCNGEKHDPRIPLIKNNFLVGGRKVNAKEELAPTAVLYHRRQIETLYNTKQYLDLSCDNLKLYSRINMSKRFELTAFLEQTLRGRSLAQWEAISRRAAELKSDLEKQFGVAF